MNKWYSLITQDARAYVQPTVLQNGNRVFFTEHDCCRNRVYYSL